MSLHSRKCLKIGFNCFNHIILTIKHGIIAYLILVLCSCSLLLQWISFKRLEKSKDAELNSKKSTNSDESDVTLGNSDLRLSLIIATRDNAKTISSTLNAIYSNATNKNQLEIIICDACSSDKTLEVIETFKDKLTLKLVNIKGDNPHSVPSRGKALNAGIMHSQGDLILFIRPDITHLPIAFDEIVKNRFKEGPSIIMCSFTLAIEHPNHKEDFAFFHWTKVLELYWYLRTKYTHLPCVGHQCLVVPSNICKRLLFSEEIVLEEVDFVDRLRKLALSVQMRSKITNDRKGSSGYTTNVVLLPFKIQVSAFRYKQMGVVKYTFLELLAHTLFLQFRFSPHLIFCICYDFIPYLLRRFRM